MGNVKFDINIDELKKINSNIGDVKASLQNNFANIAKCFEDLSANVSGNEINTEIGMILNNMDTAEKKIDASLEKLINFLSVQMKNYTVTYQDAVANFNKTLDFINNNL